MQQTLLIFIKNPVLGKAKTRIAQTVGDEKALAVYLALLEHTRNITKSIAAQKHLYYSSFVDLEDEWDNDIFQKKLQATGTLGHKMQLAFQTAFKTADRVLIIGSDCASLSSEIIEQAFAALEQHDFVIGPAKDGGYYLLGMRTLQPAVFENIAWSTDQVLPTTLERIKTLGKSYFLLPTLSDIDYWEDWLTYGWALVEA
ncbi:MAG: TIGR04282 family arsenosugar biosynthesis glycosyltransferase [Bacteroidota bacterium]